MSQDRPDQDSPDFDSTDLQRPTHPLRYGWTTGACATAATRAAYEALFTGEFPDPVTITLPGGQRPAFALAQTELRETSRRPASSRTRATIPTSPTAR